MEAASYQPATPGKFFPPSQVSALFRVLAPVSLPRQSIFRPMENFHPGLRSRCRYDSSERPRTFTGLYCFGISRFERVESGTRMHPTRTAPEEVLLTSRDFEQEMQRIKEVA